MIRKALLIVASIIGILLILAFALFLHFQPTFDFFTPSLVDYQLRIKEGEVVGRRDGEVQFRLIAKEIEEIEDHQFYFTGEPYGEFYQGSEVAHIITSDTILYHTKKGDLEFLGSVSFETLEGDRLLTDLLLWSDKDDELLSPGPVKLFMDGAVLEAKKMRVFYREEIFDFFDDVVLTVSSKRP